jgi:hypothetical protein
MTSHAAAGHDHDLHASYKKEVKYQNRVLGMEHVTAR